MNRRTKENRPPSTAKQQKLVDLWNAKNPIGTRVQVHGDLGKITITHTRSGASILGGHTAVVWLDDVAGAYLLEYVTPL